MQQSCLSLIKKYLQSAPEAYRDPLPQHHGSLHFGATDHLQKNILQLR